MVEDFFKYGGYLLGFLGTGKTGRTGSYLSKIGTGNCGTGSGTVEALVSSGFLHLYQMNITNLL